MKYEQWYQGDLHLLYKTPSPNEKVKVVRKSLREASVLTWHRLHQEPKYLCDLELERDAFEGRIVLDVGSGPIPSATCFTASELYCLDQLHSQYANLGFPYDCYQDNVHFVAGSSEQMPLEDAYFDVVLAVNSIDHVDNIENTAKEIRRVLKPGGELRMHVHYHSPTITEPLAFSDLEVARLFSWCPNFRKLSEHSHSYSDVRSPEEKFVLWGNSRPISSAS